MTALTFYAIVIKDQLDDDWNDWFAGMRLRYSQHGETILEGPVVDQTALHGLINKIFMLGLSLVSVNRYEPKDLSQHRRTSQTAQGDHHLFSLARGGWLVHLERHLERHELSSSS